VAICGYLCRKDREGLWIGKKVNEPFLHEEKTSKEWEQKPDNYIIFKDLLKSCNGTVNSLLLVKY
jgi:hypothetical protein